jgi:hypothetical protein
MTASMNSPQAVKKVAKALARAEHPDDKTAYQARRAHYLAVAETVTDIVRAEIADELRTLATLRREYGGPDTPHEDVIAREVHTARLLAKLIGRDHDALGWLPSWAVPRYAKKHNPNGTEVFER